jgi:pseudouridine synthase
LQKILADAGLGSRRACETWILDGRVSVNGVRVTRLGTRAAPDRDRILVDGRPIPRSSRKLYFLLNKPRGCLSTLSDPEGRPTVRDILRDVRARVFPVGRLDWDTEGLLLLTNDGDFAQAVAHPSHGCPKRYEAKVRSLFSDKDLGLLRRGFRLGRTPFLPMRVRLLVRTRRPSYEVVLREGRKNQIRRIFLALGNPVERLRRIGIGPLRDPFLPTGKYRELTSREISLLRRASKPVPGRTGPAGRRPAAPPRRSGS